MKCQAHQTHQLENPMLLLDFLQVWKRRVVQHFQAIAIDHLLTHEVTVFIRLWISI